MRGVKREREKHELEGGDKGKEKREKDRWMLNNIGG